jgi:hypothetical protein
MAKKLQLKIKKKEAAPAAPAAGGAPAPTIGMPQVSVAAPAGGGIKIILKNAKIEIGQVIVKREGEKEE